MGFLFFHFTKQVLGGGGFFSISPKTSVGVGGNCSSQKAAGGGGWRREGRLGGEMADGWRREGRRGGGVEKRRSLGGEIVDGWRREGRRGGGGGGRSPTGGEEIADTVTATTESDCDGPRLAHHLFSSLLYFSFLAVSPNLQIWCMELISEGLIFIEIFFSTVGRL